MSNYIHLEFMQIWIHDYCPPAKEHSLNKKKTKPGLYLKLPRQDTKKP